VRKAKGNQEGEEKQCPIHEHESPAKRVAGGNKRVVKTNGRRELGVVSSEKEKRTRQPAQ